MKRIRSVLAVLFAFVIFIATVPNASAFDKKEHDKYMRDVLFKSFKNVENDKTADNLVKALESASYLSIDQYNGKGQSDLDYLKDFGVKGLPTLNEIDYTANSYHRRATHRGWNAEIGVYNTQDAKRWTVRKQILLNTAEKIFDFKGNEKQKESFCAIIYYTHILGDRIADNKYYVNADIIELGGRIDKQDIIDELIVNFECLFESQKHTHKYNSVVTKLNSYNTKISKLLKKDNGNLSEEDFKEYQKYAEKAMDLLRYNVPEMLKEEDFFNGAFYK